jgi:hypothetical protein
MRGGGGSGLARGEARGGGVWTRVATDGVEQGKRGRANMWAGPGWDPAGSGRG